MEKGLSDRKIIRESPAIIEGRYSLSKVETDIVMAMLTTISKDDKDFKEYTFSLNELQEKIGRPLNATRIKKYAKELMSKPLEVNTEKGFELFSWFSHFSYNKESKSISCGFDRRLKPYLLELKQYALGDYQQLLQMKSNYSKRIYMLLKQYKKLGSREIEIEELKALLFPDGVPKSYNEYNQFKTKVINQAKKDINAYTDLVVDYTEKKNGRKVVALDFRIRENKKRSVIEPKPLKSSYDEFLALIRKEYTNIHLLNDSTQRAIACSENGYLYYEDDQKDLDKDHALKVWQFMYEHKDSIIKNAKVLKAKKLEDQKYDGKTLLDD